MPPKFNICCCRRVLLFVFKIYIYKCQILSLLCCWQPVFALVPKTSCVHFRREKKDIRDWLLRTDILECVCVCANKKINRFFFFFKKRKAIKRLSKSHWGEKEGGLLQLFSHFRNLQKAEWAAPSQVGGSSQAIHHHLETWLICLIDSIQLKAGEHSTRSTLLRSKAGKL